MAMRKRRGNYSMLSALMIFVMMGFGAISVDLSLVRLGASQAQDVSDAASQAAIVLYRQGRYEGLTDGQARTLGEQGARFVANRNRVVGMAPNVSSVVWGEWDVTASPGSEFTSTSVGAGTTAVQVNLDRSGVNAIGLPFATVFGRAAIPVRGAAISASRNLQAILTIDITGSWDKDEFQHARAAALAFFDILAENHGPEDRFGVVVWFNSYAFEYVPMMKIDDATANPSIARDPIAALEVGNYTGVPEASWNPPGSTSKHVACKIYGTAGTGNNPWGSSGSFYGSL